MDANRTLPILEKEWDSLEDLMQDLVNNFFPEAETLDYQNTPVPGLQKYTWSGHLVLKYYGEYYKFDYTCIGNCAWTTNFDLYKYKVVSVNKVTRNLREVKTFVPEYGILENIIC